ncbi:hypothetical protein D3C86_1648510 [compost metagenome]
MLNAYMSFLPVTSAALSTASMTAFTLSAKGAQGGFAFNSSSLMKSMPALASFPTNVDNSSVVNPMLGFTIVPRIGRS